MKLIRGTYPNIPGVKGSPCWKLRGKWIDIDADWNIKFPFGTSFGLHAGRNPAPEDGPMAPGFLLDLNAPLGEPNRLYVWFGGWHIVLGLPEFRDFRVTRREKNEKGQTIIHGEHFTNWLHPHIGDISRYKYHRDKNGKWVRNEKPEPMHWGWLTIERKNS